MEYCFFWVNVKLKRSESTCSHRTNHWTPQFKYCLKAFYYCSCNVDTKCQESYLEAICSYIARCLIRHYTASLFRKDFEIFLEIFSGLGVLHNGASFFGRNWSCQVYIEIIWKLAVKLKKIDNACLYL